MRLPDSRIGKEHFTFCTPVLIEVDTELCSRSMAYLLIHSLLTLYQLPGCSPGCLSQNMHSYCRWLWWWRTNPIIHACTNNFVWHLAKLSTTVSIYLKRLLLPLTWAVQTPSRYEVDPSLPKAIRASHIVVSACDTFPVCHFPGDGILLFKMPCQWVWVMAAETKRRKYIRVHNTGKLLQMAEHVLPLNIQMNTNI